MLHSKTHNSKSEILFFFLLPSVFSVVILLSTLCHAQTEIEGEVSGVWTAEDSPYIITDSTWVPGDSTLTIEAGVTVRFGEGVGLDVFGLISVEGTEEDSVFFTSVHDTVLWKGINVHKEREFQYFKYLTLNNAVDGLLLADRGYIDLKHTLIATYDSPLYRMRGGGDGTRIELEDCHLLGGKYIGNLVYSRFNAKKTIFKAGMGIDLSFSSAELDSCTVYGSYGWFVQGKISNSTIYNENDSTISRIYMSGSVYNSTIKGNLWVVGGVDEQCVISNSTVGGTAELDADDVLIDSSEFRNEFGGLSIECVDLAITNSMCQGSFRVVSKSDVLVNGCSFLSNDTQRIDLNILGNDMYDNDRYFIVERCIIQGSIDVNSAQRFDLINNTFVLPRDVGGYAVVEISFDIEIASIRNNVFLGIETEEPTFYDQREVTEETLEIRYNCINGFEEVFNEYFFRRNNPDYRLDESNILENPQLYSLDPLEPYLTWESPCIDAGDPDSPEDPDGSRADMGAFWFDHRLSAEQDSSFILHPSAFILSSVYPNPFNSHLSIDLDASLPVQVSVYDPLGRVVKSGRYNQRHINLSFDGSHLSTGTYFLYINDGRQDYIQRLTLLR